MKKNVILLTAGLSGSSVLTALIARAGYWTRNQTFKKPDYDTHENKELISLNNQLIKESGYRGIYTEEFDEAVLWKVASLYQNNDSRIYSEFLEKCNRNSPWIWKDPRLWLTIKYWIRLLDIDNTQFIILSRDNLQSWISEILRRQIKSFKYSKSYNANILSHLFNTMKDNNCNYISLLYEDLVLKPEITIEKLNSFLGCALTIEDLKKIYNKPLKKLPRGKLDLLKAILIYSKNINNRIG